MKEINFENVSDLIREKFEVRKNNYVVTDLMVNDAIEMCNLHLDNPTIKDLAKIFDLGLLGVFEIHTGGFEYRKSAYYGFIFCEYRINCFIASYGKMVKASVPF